MRNIFHIFSAKASEIVGSPWAFSVAILALIIWAVTGPLLGFSDTWQLIINTSTTIVTFLIVFLIQNTQNRESKAVNLKLDALVKATKGASNKLVDIEEMSDETLADMADKIHSVRRSRKKKQKR